MTENEAIKKLKEDTCYECTYGCDSAATCSAEPCTYKSAVKMAIQALEDIQAYRELGTMEKILKVLNNQRTVIATQHETLRQYRAIGTVDECAEMQVQYNYLSTKIKKYEDAEMRKEQEIRNKVIDEFVENLKPLLNTYADTVRLDEIAEQMKGGVK